ncbi:nitrous oxide reductase accessory protein NosL [Rummeliibacillus pycnus]|uniref:nitrous oxide reductase accessory protein NosL n=1 Tax=Rummeliibacillus pycnus TaxID=101070 RepID=UPI003D2B7B16
MKKWWLISIFTTLLLLQACGNKEYKPKEIVSETDVCKVCNMSIVHKEFAGEIAFTNGDYEMFDDLGCLIEYMKNMNEKDLGKAFIKDQDGKKWLNVQTASYVYEKDIWTPMSYGVIAFQTENSAKNYIKKEGKGELLSFDDLKTFKWGVHH